MIVYNVDRLWFAKKENAEKIRISRGLKPGATITVEVNDRDDLTALLNALCSPVTVKTKVMEAVVEHAYVDPHIAVPDYIPKFLVKEQEQREALHRRVKELKP